MSDAFLSWLVIWGQVLGLTFAILAATAGMISGFAGQQLARRSDEKLTSVLHQVGTVIGKKWDPLTSSQIELLSQQISKINAAAALDGKVPRAQVMYENAFGKDLAGSIALAFKAAGWDTTLGPGSGFESGIKVGPGPIGPQLRAMILQVTGIKDVSALRPEEPNHGFNFVGVGANTE